MFRNLTTIIVISFITVLAIVLTVLSLVSYRIFFDFTSEEISETRLTLLNENTDKLWRVTSDISEAGYYLAANHTIIEIFSEPVTNAYDAISEQRDLFEQLSIMAGMKPNIYSLVIYTDRYEGFPVLRDSRLQTMEALEAEPWHALLDNIDSGWVPLEENGRSMVSYIHRLVDHRGNKVGYVRVNVFEEIFFSDLNVIEHPDASHGLVLIIDSGDRVLARTPSEEGQALVDELAVKREESPFYRLKDEYRAMNNHHQLFTHKSDRYLLLVSDYSNNRWKLVQLIPIDPLYEGTRKLGMIVNLLGFGILLLSVPLVYWLGKRIILRPIRKIILGIKQVERGNFNARVKPLYIEEFNHMANHFNRMTRELGRSIEQIEREHWARRDAEMKMLQTQIMPHFLYNTLDIIHWRAMDYQAEDISQMVYSLSRMFRIGLSGGRNFIRLRDELEHVRCYIDIQRLRITDRFIDYETNVPTQCKDYFVPKIILQPFVENSMKHGYLDRTEDTVKIAVDVREEEQSGDLLIEITDRGIGFPDGWSLADASGIGMKNVQERIWMYCGTDYPIEIGNHPDGGARVVIRLPVLRTQEQVEISIAANSEPFDRTFTRR